MAPLRSPYRPGETPLVLVGRSAILERIERRLTDANAANTGHYRPIILEGVRGAGKSSILDWIDDPIMEQGWVRIGLQATRRRTLAASLDSTLNDIRRSTDLQKYGPNLKSIVTEIGLSIGPLSAKRTSTKNSPSENDPIERTLGNLMRPIVEHLTKSRAGVVLTVDEFQDARLDGFYEVADLLDQAKRLNWRIMVVLAGLAKMREDIAPTGANGGSLGVFERAEWIGVGARLDQAQTIRAIVEPAGLENFGVSIDDAAVQRIWLQTGGYPFAVQIYGEQMWNVRPRTKGHRITRVDADKAGENFRYEMESSILMTRWSTTPPVEKAYLVAMAQVLKDTTIQKTSPNALTTNGQVAHRMGKTAKETSYLRDRLIKRGTVIRESEQGISLLTPAMRDFVLAQPGSE